MRRTVGVIFHAPLGDSPVERLVEEGRWASTLGLARRLRAAQVPVCVVTSDAERIARYGDAVTFLLPSASIPFHFGRELGRAVRELDADGLLYFGSGAGGLLAENDLPPLIEFARGEMPRALFNNFYSCDFCVLSSARAALQAELPAIDNSLGFALADAGVPCCSLSRTPATQFDIDTPVDLALLARHGGGSTELQAFCAGAGLGHPTLDRALAVLTDRSAVTCVIGRLSPVTWSSFEGQVACRTSALAEGRGMHAGASRLVPWLRQTLESTGPGAFFDRLAEACDAAWIDTRPLLGTPDVMPPADVRFSSDLFQLAGVADSDWRAFTEAALRCRIPVVLGGHSLVSGGLLLAAETCWKGKNLARRLHPEPFA